MLNIGGFPGDTGVKNPPADSGDTGEVVLILYEEDPLEKEMSIHPSTLVWPAIVHGVSEDQM